MQYVRLIGKQFVYTNTWLTRSGLQQGFKALYRIMHENVEKIFSIISNVHTVCQANIQASTCSIHLRLLINFKDELGPFFKRKFSTSSQFVQNLPQSI